MAGRSSIFSTGQNDRFEAEQRFREAIDFADASKLLQIPGFTDAAIAANATNADALMKMDETTRRTLVALDAENKPTGIAKRDAIVTHLLVQRTSRQFAMKVAIEFGTAP